MAIAPTTVVKLYEGVPWSRDKLDFRYFGTYAKRNAYFNETLTPKAVFTNFTYLRNEEGHPISVPIGAAGYNAQSDDKIPNAFGQIMRCNYVFYQNPSYAESWFGGFITDVVYKNDGCAWIYFEEDIYQNWFSNITIDSGFIERETVDSDTIGKHRLDEGFSGNYVVTAKKHGSWLDVTNLTPVLFLTEPPLSNLSNTPLVSTIKTSDYFKCCGAGFLTGWQTPLYCLYLKDTNYYNNSIGGHAGGSYIAGYAAKDPSVVALRMYPIDMINKVVPLTIKSESGERWTFESQILQPPYELTIGDMVGYITEEAASLKLDGGGYKNNKLKTSPYVKMRAVFNGSESEYAYENFTEAPKFRVSATIGVDSDYSCKAINYCNYTDDATGPNNNKGCLIYEMRSNGCPAFGWTKDSFSQWYSYNNVPYRGFKAATNLISGALGGVSGALYNPVSGLNGSIYGMPDLLMEGYQADREPDRVGELGYSGTTWANNDGGLNTYCMSFNSDLLHSIDNYFSMFGYKVNRVGKPKLTSRKNWNYIKTQNAHCSGAAPQYAIEFMERALDTGCTFWHKNAVGDYGDLSNPIV